MDFKFETELKMLKHMVLKSVAKLAKEDKLSIKELEKIPYEIIEGEKAKYRCCVYKERAIVAERAKLAAGYLANGDNGNEDFIDISQNKQIVYIIEAACDRCPINKFTITDVCRGCLAHRCREACAFNAILHINGRAYINQELCKECGMCKKACPYDAISEVMRPCKGACPTGALCINLEDRNAMIDEKDCINCGRCMAACPFGAISDRSSIGAVSIALSKKENLYAVVAPAITGQFGFNVSYGKIKNAILKLGFKDMIEAALGADAVTVLEAKELKECLDNGEKYLINSCCPAVVSFIEKKYPNETNKISKTVSPMIATARYIKNNDSKAKVVFIGPCTAKKSEGMNFQNDIDYVITFEELLALIDAFDIDIENCKDEKVKDASIFGRGFGVQGGLTNSIKNYIVKNKINIDFQPIKVSGLEIKKTMNLAKIKKLQGNFIEGMMCDGGCINGPCTIKNHLKAKAIFNKINEHSNDNNEIKENFNDINLKR